MKVNEVIQTCGACPTVYEWTNGKKEQIYFRLRHGFARITNENTGKVYLDEEMPEFDGVCNWSDVVKWAKEHGLKL